MEASTDLRLLRVSQELRITKVIQRLLLEKGTVKPDGALLARARAGATEFSSRGSTLYSMKCRNLDNI